MLTLIVSITIFVFAVGSVLFLRHIRQIVVPEDSISVTVDRNGFISRVLTTGTHLLRPFETVDFTLEIKPKLTTGRAPSIVTSDGIALHISWSGIYAINPDLITEHRSRRLRGLVNGEKAIARKIDVALRKLVGDYGVQELFKPSIRERIERQVSRVVADGIKPAGLVLTAFDLQVLEIPREVAEALNKAKAMQALDGTIRQLDATTREMVRGAYQLDEILHWDQYLPRPSRLTMKHLQAEAAD